MRLELRWEINEAHDEQHVRHVILIAESKRESKLLDDAFGEDVGDDGVIDCTKREVICKLSDGLDQHYVSIDMRTDSSATEV